MASNSAADCTTCAPHNHCHSCPEEEPLHPFFATKEFKEFMNVLEKISLIALVIISFVVEPEITGYSALAGFGIGLYFFWGKEIKPQPKKPANACTQATMEQLTGTKLPPPIALGFNVLVLYIHVEHHPGPFACIVGASAGFYAAKLFSEYAPKFYAELKTRMLSAFCG